MAQKRQGSLKVFPIGLSNSEPDAKAKANGHLVEQLATAAIYASGHLVRCPHFLLELLKADAWKHFADPHTREVYNYDNIDAFARARIPAGLQIPDGIAGLIRICQNIPSEESTAALRILEAMVPPIREAHRPKNDEKLSNINLSVGGTKRTYTLARLKKEAPALADRVIAGELSANAAAIEAGFRERMVQHPATVDGFLRGIEKHLTTSERRALKNKL